MPPRRLSPGQSCQVRIFDTETMTDRLLFETGELLLEAPNWTLDGRDLVLNGDGRLWRLSVEEPSLRPIEIHGLPPANNDHVLDPDGSSIFISTYDDWQIYRAPLRGGTAVPVTGAGSMVSLRHFLHGVSPDGGHLAFVGLVVEQDGAKSKVTSAEIYTITADGQDLRQLTYDKVPADGPEYGPDGAWIYFNTEAFTGHAQIARMRVDGSDLTRLSFSETVDWFPHLSPDGSRAVYLAYPTNTQGHPADLWVDLMIVKKDNWHSSSHGVRLFGGQGTINVNSWSPDNRHFAYVAYSVW